MSRKLFVIAAILIALLTVSVLTCVYVFNGNLLGWNNHNTPSHDKTSANLDKPTDEQVKAGNDIKKQSVDKAGGSTHTPPAPISQPGSAKQSVEIIITAANQNSGTLQVRAQISRVVSTGQCTLIMSRAGQNVIKTADVQSLASTSTCKGFDIPISQLSPGSWQLTLTYENDALTGSASEVTTIQ